MNIFDGLEKFGLSPEGMDNLFSDGKKSEVKPAKESEETKEKLPEEEDFLLEKSVRCIVCDNVFSAKAVKSSKLRRLQPDKDLRPRYQYVDANKYDVISCPYCGYTAMPRYFEHLSPGQIRLIKEEISSKFKPHSTELPATYDYDMALEYYKLALYNTIVKKGSVSEKAYICLKMSWLCRGKAEEFLGRGATEDSQTMQRLRQEEKSYYEQAFEGLQKAVASESFPICGMDQNTMDLLLAEMAYKLEKYETASKLLSRLLVSQSANRNVKDRALDLKQEIIETIHKTTK
jgi:uncharacterized protein (DUF2225 family)